MRSPFARPAAAPEATAPVAAELPNWRVEPSLTACDGRIAAFRDGDLARQLRRLEALAELDDARAAAAEVEALASVGVLSAAESAAAQQRVATAEAARLAAEEAESTAARQLAGLLKVRADIEKRAKDAVRPALEQAYRASARRLVAANRERARIYREEFSPVVDAIETNFGGGFGNELGASRAYRVLQSLLADEGWENRLRVDGFLDE